MDARGTTNRYISPIRRLFVLLLPWSSITQDVALLLGLETHCALHGLVKVPWVLDIPSSTVPDPAASRLFYLPHPHGGVVAERFTMDSGDRTMFSPMCRLAGASSVQPLRQRLACTESSVKRVPKPGGLVNCPCEHIDSLGSRIGVMRTSPVRPGPREVAVCFLRSANESSLFRTSATLSTCLSSLSIRVTFIVLCLFELVSLSHAIGFGFFGGVQS